MSPRGEEPTGAPRRASAIPVRVLLPDELLLAARSNRPRARARLVEAFMPLIGSAARMYRYVPGVERAELVQEGVVGMLRALERYDPELGTPFWAYASWWVREAMQQLVSELSRPMVLSDRALRQLAHVRAARKAFARAHSREPTVSELASASGLSTQRVQRLAAAERLPRAFERRVVDRDGDAAAPVVEFLADPRAEDAYEELTTRLTATQVPRLLEQLSERERSVIKARYGLGGRQQSLRELGESMGLSAERVRQIEQAALGILRSTCLGKPYAPGSGTRRSAERSPRKPLAVCADGEARSCLPRQPPLAPARAGTSR